MVGLLHEIKFYLLQDSYFKEDDPRAALILGIAVGAVILVAVLVHFIRHGVSSSVAGKGKSNITPRKFNMFTLRRVSSTYGLEKEQSRLLEYIFRSGSVADPEKVMKNPPILDRHFKRTYKNIEKNSETEEDAQQRLVKLFGLRNVIESAPVDDGGSNRLAENTPAVLSNGSNSYPVKIISSRGHDVVVEVPRNTLGTPVRFARNMKIMLSFFTKSSKGFSLDGHAAGTVDTPRGPGLHIVHSGKTKALVKRRFRRKQTSIKCEFFMVFLDETGASRKTPAKLVVDSRRFTGTILDISVGGCALKTSAPVQPGSRMKLSIDYNDDYLINVLGQALRTNRSGAAGTIVHVKFLKVPRRAFNTISALVFGYDDD